MTKKTVAALLLSVILVIPALSSCEFSLSMPSGEVELQYSYAADLGIGYGYDVLNSVYFDSGQVKKRNAVLDPEKAVALVSKTPYSTSRSGGIYSESVADYLRQYEKRLELGVEMSGEFSIFSYSVGMSFDINGSDELKESIKKGGRQVYYTYFDDINCYYLEMKNYDENTLSGMLSDFFLADLEKEGMTPEEHAEYLINKYGTHVITGLQMGGRLEYSYIITSESEETHKELKSALNLKFSEGVKGLISSDINSSENARLDTLLSTSGVHSEISIRRLGGMSTGLWSHKELQENYSAWAESLNNSENLNAVGIAPEGMVALWALIPSEHFELIEAMRSLYRTRGLDAYNTTLESYSSAPVSDTHTVDLTSIYSGGGGEEIITTEGISHPSFDPESGIFTLYGSLDGNRINRYIIRGMYGVEDKNGIVVEQSMNGISFCIQSEHDIEIVLENFSFGSAKDLPAMYLSKTVQNRSLTVTVTSCGKESGLDHGMCNLIYGGGGTAIELPSLVIGGDCAMGIMGAEGKDDDPLLGVGTDGGTAIIADKLTVSGTCRLIIEGGDGGDGRDYSEFVGVEVPDATAGHNGGDGIRADEVIFDRPESAEEISISGGDGGNGGNGIDGVSGADGAQLNSVPGNTGHVDGYDGTNGKAGASGGRGGMAINSKSIGGIGTGVLVGGDGGKGGRGGDGGNGGNGANGVFNSFGGSLYNSNNGGNGGNGGNGAKGGDGGTAGLAAPITAECPAGFTKEDGECGKRGDSGKGGDGGKGGIGASFQHPQSDAPIKYGEDGKDGDGGEDGDGIYSSAITL